MIYRHQVTLFLILIFSLKLWSRKSFRDAETKYFWVTVVSVLFLVFEDTLEVLTSLNPALRFWRILISVLGYTFRTSAAVGLLLVLMPPQKRRFWVWIPNLVLLLVTSTAFFTDICFGFDEEYHFYRGPLGYIVFIVPMLYLLLLLWTVILRFSEKNGLERFVMPACAVFCLVAAVSDAFVGGTRINEAIMISSIFFYIMLYSHDNRHDRLTGLLNRQAFYEDCTNFGNSVGAVASFDMNGLKEINDTLGHHAGDEALVRIGKCISQAADHRTEAYRVGGDEFVLLFFSEGEAGASEMLSKIKDSVKEAGYHISAGYAIRQKGVDLEDTVKQADSKMYEDKTRYYQEKGHDRRRRLIEETGTEGAEQKSGTEEKTEDQKKD